jgi:hypothetical protein
MTEEQLKLSRDLAYHPAFKWALGMLAIYEDPTAWQPLFLSHPADIRYVEGKAYPDITDPSTVGVMLYTLSEDGVKSIVHAPLTKEEFGSIVARELLKELNQKDTNV